MPLLHKQKFERAEIPKDLNPNQEVFFSKQTREIFLEYDDYFERTILCNSLVWTCSLTGKQGLTFSEALDSEKKARKQLAAFPSVLEKALVYIISLTKRGNFKDIIDDVLGFSKDRFFLGENILLSRDGSSKSDSQKTCKIIEILLPHETKSSKHDDSLMDMESSDLNRSSRSQTSSQQAAPVTNGLKINPDKIKYVIEIESKLNGNTTTKTIRATEIRRPLNTLTKDKLCIIIKSYFDVVKDGMWTVTESARKKFNLNEVLYSEIFKGEPPIFDVTYGRGQFSRATKQSKSPNGKSKSPNGKKQSESSKSSSKSLKSSKSTSAISNSKSSKNDHKTDKKSMKKQAKSTSKLEKATDYDSENEIPQHRINQVLSKRVVDMNEEEFFIWRDYKQDDELKELTQIDIEFEKIQKRDKIAKEKERLKAEKRREKQQLLELKKPKEDFECENLKPIPKGKPVQSKISQEMLGDALIILEFLNNFGEVFELYDDFPHGFDYDLLENALYSNSCDSALCNLLLFFLDSIFKCFDEETFDDVNEENESINDDLAVPNDSDDEEVGLDQLYNQQTTEDSDREAVALLSDNFAKLVKTVQGRSVKNIGLDVYTITEMLRLYFLTAGSEHHSKAKFWYQQRGGYTRMDEIGLDFALNEKSILKKLEKTLVYELAAEEKLKILISLCHQLMSHVRFRDITEDNLQKVSVLKGQLRDLQTEENRRIREETSFQWKKRNEDRVKEKAKLEEIKSNILNAQVKDETNACLEKIKMINEAENAKFLNESTAKREAFLKKEKNILNEIYEVMYKCEMYPIGKDRYFRRYWTFKSIPGVFVEDTNDSEEVNILLEGNLNRVYKQQPENSSEDGKDKAQNEIQNHGKSEEYEQSNGKENKPQLSDLTNLNTSSNQNGQITTKAELSFNELVKAEVFTTDYVKDETKWSFFTSSDDIELLINSLNERGIRESELKTNLIDLKEKITENVMKKSCLIKSLTLTKEEITKSIENSLKENINSILANTLFANPKQNKRQATKLAASLALNNFAEHVATKHLEIHLHDKIIDLEDQLFIGSLGSIKNIDRASWKASLLFENTDSPDTDETIKLKLNKFCTALLQLEQSVEKRFLRTPLGECQNTPTKKRTKPVHHDSGDNDDDKYQILHNWEKSLMHCTNYSQVFIHLQSLDESIAWSKSAMNTRCRICKKKGDAERMLLCDKCDNGHHMFCLRPQLNVIPDGQWFCPECKPKDAEKTPRKIRNIFKDGDLYSDDKETEDDEADSDNEEAYESDDTLEAKSDTSTKKIKKSTITKNIFESDDHSENNSVEDDGENTVEESSDDEDDNQNDSDYAVKGQNNNKNKYKFNAFNIKNKKSKIHESDEETLEETDEDVDSRKKSSRKRKLTEEKIAPKIAKALKVNQMEPKDIIRNARSKKPVYNEISESADTETDEDVSKKRKKNKRNDENSTEEEFSTNTSTRNTDVEQRLKTITKLLNDLVKHKDGWPFLKPVTKREAPDYFDIIKRPMDFSTIKNNINNFKYEDYTSIIEDIRLVFQNCRDYNEPGSEIYDLNERIEAYFEKEAKKAGLLDTKQLAQPKCK